MPTSSDQLAVYSRDLVAWAESEAGYYVPETGQPITLASHHARILRYLFTADESGRFPHNVIVWSEPKKSLKTTIAALVHQWFSLTQEIPGEQYVIGNDLEGAKSRVFRYLIRSAELNPYLSPAPTTVEWELANGTLIKAIGVDYRGEAGANHTIVSIDEPWGVMYESARRLIEEFTPTPSRRNSVQLFTGYAGWLGESQFWRELYERGMSGEPVPELADIENGKGEPACRRVGNLFCFWSHLPRLDWHTESYLADQRANLRPNTYRRLWLNEWVSNESAFVTQAEWEWCRDLELRPLQPGDQFPIILAADAATSGDTAALVGVTYNKDRERVETVFTRVWRPERGVLRGGKPTIDLAETLGGEIDRLYEANYRISAIVADPYQLHSLLIAWEKAGLRVIEFPQGGRRVEADQALYTAIVSQSLAHYGDPTLTEHVLNAVAVETPRGFRLAKEKTTLKIDSAVALSMAHHAALELLKGGTSATMEAQPNPFYGEGPDESIPPPHISPWRYPPQQHKPGVTWRNCRWRNKGCPACMDEWAEEERRMEREINDGQPYIWSL